MQHVQHVRFRETTELVSPVPNLKTKLKKNAFPSPPLDHRLVKAAPFRGEGAEAFAKGGDEGTGRRIGAGRQGGDALDHGEDVLDAV